MLEVNESPFASEYTQALAQYMAQLDDRGIQCAREIGSLAKSLGMLSYEVAIVHADALRACVPQRRPEEFATAALFLVESLRTLESESALQRDHSLKRAAHELRTPLTTLRLALQVSLGRLEKGDRIEPTVLQKALAQVDRLTTKITEMVSSQDKISMTSTAPTP